MTSGHDISPVALYGALRSGTTLFRLLLDHHPGLHNPGETDFLLDHIDPDPAHPSGWRYDRAALQEDRVFGACEIPLRAEVQGRDLLAAMIAALAAKASDRRLVLVFHRNAGKLAALLPDAPVLHLLRDPRDVARSSIGMGWAGNSYYGVDHWIATERGWDEAVISPGRALDVRFEALMADLEAELTRICAFVALDFEPEMLRYHEHSTYGPPNPAIAQKWRQKISPREIARIEAKAGPLMAARGYPAEMPAGPPGMMERAWLAVEHRVRRWRFNARRYGAALFFGHYAARMLGLSFLADRLAKQQEAIQTKNLK